MTIGDWRFPESKQAAISVHYCENELSELLAAHLECHMTYEEIVELDICRDVHQVSTDLDVCFTISYRCRQMSQPAVR
jgi:hypothetical protein